MLPALYAHRFGREGGPDSSWPALRTALAGPAQGLETDVCLTADGRLALLHDPLLDVGTTATGWVHRTQWAAIAEGARLRDRNGRPTRERVLCLEEALDAIPSDRVLQLDVKTHGDTALGVATVEAIARQLSVCGRSDDVEILSFHAPACRAAARLGLRARLIVWADYAPEGLASWARGAGVADVCVEHFLLHAELVETLRDGGLGVATGTVNDQQLAARVAALGVDAITTDVPERLAADQLALSTAMIRG